MSEKDVETELAALRAEVADLKAQVERAKPPASVKALVVEAGEPGPTTTQLAMNRVSLSPEVMAEFAQAVGDLRGAWRSPTAGPTSMVVEANAAPKSTRAPGPVNNSGWRDATPLGPPPGVAQADRLMDAQDARDRAELIAREAKRLVGAKPKK
jgi:hypothetical protein